MTGKSGKAFPSNLLIIKHYQLASSVSVDGSGTAKSIKTSDMGLSNPTGYVPIGITKVTTYSAAIGLSYFGTDASSTYCIGVRNGASSSSTTKPILDIVYAPADYVETGTNTTGKLFKVLEFEKAYSAAKTTSLQLSATDFGFYIPSGYQVFSITKASTGSSAINIYSFDPFETDCIMQVRNAGSSAISTTASIGVSFIRKDYAEQILA